MKLPFLPPHNRAVRILILALFVAIVQFPGKASTMEGCSDYECEDVTLIKAIPYLLDLETLTGEWCSYLSFTPHVLNHSLLITHEGITEFTVYHLLTGDSCTANIEIICGVLCPEDTTFIMDYDQDSISLQATTFSYETCHVDEEFLQPYESGVFEIGEYEVTIYSPALDESCTFQLNITDECHVINCSMETNEYYNTTIWPQRILQVPCPDTTAYLMEVLDENNQVLLSGNSIFLEETLPDTSHIRITHIETGNHCTSELRLFQNCLQYVKDTIMLDFTGIESITVPWDSIFTVPCDHQYTAGYGSLHVPQGDDIIFSSGDYTFKNSFQNTNIHFVDLRTDSIEFVPIFFRNQSLSLVQGFVFQDLEGDCDVDTIPEFGAANALVYAISESDTFFTHTFPNGLFNFQIPEFYDYEVGLLEFNNYWDVCVNGSPFYLGEGFETVHIGLSIDTLCSYLATHLAIPRFRRCFDNSIFIDYCNYGSDTAYDVTLDLYFDEGLEIDAEEYGFTVIDDTHYQLELGDLEPLECGSLTLVAFVDCDLDFGTELCVEVELGPIPDCNDDEDWSGAALNVEGSCEGDSVRFIITNIGDADMTGSQDFIVIEDDIMIIQDETTLPEGESIEVVLPANGSTYRLIADQEPLHPYTMQVSALVKECSAGGSGISTGFANSFAQDEQAPYISIECLPVIGSYDPNDKAVTPTGAYENHVISGDEELEYTIRFENTGTDTAFTVLIRDTLDPNLDLLSYRLVGSSHTVEVDFPEDGMLFFKFLNIELPDTSVNLLGAQGFVKYTIRPKPNLPLETKIYNKADIFFDFNAPITTNTRFEADGISLSPNPAYTVLNINADFDRYSVVDIGGIQCQTGDYARKINIESLVSGIYVLQIFKKEKLIGIERFVKIDNR